MDVLTSPPVRAALALGFAALAFYCLLRGARGLAAGMRDSDHPDSSDRVIRGMRTLILAIGFSFFAGGAHFAIKWPLIFGLVFLGEELFETGIMLLALRLGKDADVAIKKPESKPVSSPGDEA